MCVRASASFRAARGSRALSFRFFLGRQQRGREQALCVRAHHARTTHAAPTAMTTVLHIAVSWSVLSRSHALTATRGVPGIGGDGGAPGGGGEGEAIRRSSAE